MVTKPKLTSEMLRNRIDNLDFRLSQLEKPWYDNDFVTTVIGITFAIVLLVGVWHSIDYLIKGVAWILSVL